MALSPEPAVGVRGHPWRCPFCGPGRTRGQPEPRQCHTGAFAARNVLRALPAPPPAPGPWPRRPRPRSSRGLLQSVPRLGPASAALSPSGTGCGPNGAAGARVRVALGFSPTRPCRRGGCRSRGLAGASAARPQWAVGRATGVPHRPPLAFAFGDRLASDRRVSSRGSRAAA